MKFLVLSDNHGRWKEVKRVLERFRPEVDYVFHCGDSEFLSDDPIWDYVDVVVEGNMDYEPRFPREEEFDTEEGRVFITHGHRHQVNFSNDMLYNLARKKGYKFVFQGHTHKLYAEYRDGVLLCNPGSLNHSRGQYKERTFAIITILPEWIHVDYYNDELAWLGNISSQFQRTDSMV